MSWDCPTCTLKNHKDVIFCESCHFKRSIPRKSGTIIRWSRIEKKYWCGFVEVDSGGLIFVDGRDLKDFKLFTNDRITFEVIHGPKGLKTRDVMKQRQKNKSISQHKKSTSIAMVLWNILLFLRYLMIFAVILISLFAAIYPIIVAYGINVIFWLMSIALLLWFVPTIKQAYSHRNVDNAYKLISILFVLYFLSFAIDFNQEINLLNHDIKISDLQYLPAKVNELEKTANESWTKYLDKDTYVKTFDDKVVSTLHKYGVLRQFGCFIAGSRIQIDKYGNTVNVEELRIGHYVFHPILKERVSIKIWTYGNETGDMYQIISRDALSVTVTEKHAMKICTKSNDNLFECDHNIAAKNVYEGNWTLTKNGYQQIISIIKFPVQNVMVYNLELNVRENSDVSSRVVIANGIYTLDLYAQTLHEKNVNQ